MKLMEDTFYQLKEAYSPDLEEVSRLGEGFLDDHGLKIQFFANDEIIYASGYEGAIQNIKPERFEKKFFSETPKVFIKEKAKKSVKGEKIYLRLCGKFHYGNQEIKVFMKLSMKSIDSGIAVFNETSIYISLFVLVIGVIVSIRVSKKLSAPISSIESASKKIAALDFSCETDENVRIKELASLAQSINEMSRKLQTTMEQLQEANDELQKDIERQNQIEKMRKDFIASVSHEMKTPLGLLQIYTENLKNNLPGIDREYYYDTIIEETDKLSQMVSRMLEISSIDSGFIQMNFAECSFTELCESILHQYNPMVDDYKLQAQICEDVKVCGDVKYIEQTIKNLLNNAIQYTAEGSTIRISLEKVQNQAVFSVYNQGNKIPEKDLPYIWEAFYRADKSRTRTIYNNTGLGLYIVKTIIDKHHGTCRIENTSDGVCVSIALEIIE